MDDLDRAGLYEQRDREAALNAVLGRKREQQEHDDEGNVICIDCGQVIPATRLAAIPDASRCITCQQKNE